MKKIYIFIIIIFTLFLSFTVNYLINFENEETLLNDLEILNESKSQIVTWGNKLTGFDTKERQKKIKVAVLDSGINKVHEDIKGIVVEEYNVLEPNQPVEDDFGHGTAIAGIIGAKNNNVGIVGISQNVELYDVKVLNEEGKGNIDQLIEGINWCIAKDIDILNISFGVPTNNQKLEKTVKEAIAAGIIIVAASGNTYGLGVDFPANYEHVISVTAIDQNLERASTSAKGKIDLSAPGVDVLSTNRDGGYSLFNGTSFATSYVTGIIAALLSEEEEEVTPKIIMEYLQNHINDLGEKSADRDYGYGLLQYNRSGE